MSRALEWALEVRKYLDAKDLPDEKWEVRNVKNQIAHFTLVYGVLYKEAFLMPLQMCVLLEEAQYLLVGIH